MRTAIVIIVLSFLNMNLSCADDQPGISEGEQLARKHCVSCHQFNDPALLDKNTWAQGILPRMAELMYVDKYYDRYNPVYGDQVVKTEDLFPYEKWEKIVSYYVINAPDSLPARDKETTGIQKGLKHFVPHFIPGLSEKAVTTMVRFDTANSRIWYADGMSGKIMVMDANQSYADSFLIGTGVADIHFGGNRIDLLTMGVMRPSDQLTGRLTSITGHKHKILLDSLVRPVQASYADLNGDGKEDIVLCEFGYKKGALSWIENKGNDNLQKHILRPLPGAITTEIHDLNNDGRPDIIAMMAQADEGIFIYYNGGNGSFREERALSFPPVYGSNGMQLTDFNGDGHLDIITTNGDNADYSIILKPYHGIRFFMNDGKNNFSETLFLPVYGVQKAIAADMDNDGDLDIASVSFFPDYEKMPEEGFIYWENTGGNHFTRNTFEGVTSGRWMTLDVGDADHDGDRDIILANGLVPFGNIPATLKEKWATNRVSAVILENTLIKK